MTQNKIITDDERKQMEGRIKEMEKIEQNLREEMEM